MKLTWSRSELTSNSVPCAAATNGSAVFTLKKSSAWCATANHAAPALTFDTSPAAVVMKVTLEFGKMVVTLLSPLETTTKVTRAGTSMRVPSRMLSPTRIPVVVFAPPGVTETVPSEPTA